MKKRYLFFVFLLVSFIYAVSFGENGDQNICDNKSISEIIKVVFISKDDSSSSLTAVYDNAAGTVKITMNNETFILPRALSADGARYADKEEKTIFWTKGDDASLWINDQLVFSGTAKEN